MNTRKYLLWCDFTWDLIYILSRLVCDSILKELEGPTKDRNAYWRRFCKVDIIISYHYIIVGEYIQMAYKCHIIHQTSYMRTPSVYRWNINRNSNNIHPASPGCQPGTNPRSTKKKNSNTSKHRSRVMIIALPIPVTGVVVICELWGLNNPITMGIKTSKA